VNPNAWEESTGLLSSLIPQTADSSTPETSAQTYNTSTGALKLGPAPISEEVRTEAERILREQALIDRDPAAHYDYQISRQFNTPGLISPSEADLLPSPPNFKTIDVAKEVERVRDIRKRVRLDPAAFSNVDANLPNVNFASGRGLPSISCYTLHDVPEGLVSFSFPLKLISIVSQGALLCILP
jgi:transcription initiation factor TFIID subunit 5